jgi:hypothetical protein
VLFQKRAVKRSMGRGEPMPHHLLDTPFRAT